MKNLIIICSLSLCFLSSCKTESKFKQLPTGAIKHQLIVAAKTTKSVRARGFAGATPPGTTVYFEVGDAHASVVSSPEGSFILELLSPDISSNFGVFNFTTKDNKKFVERYELKNLTEALSLVASEALSAVPEISFITIHNDEALILSQQAALLRRVKINSDWTLAQDSHENILLNPKVQEAPSPQMVDARKNHAVVSLFNSSELGLVDLQTNKLINNFKLDHKQTRSAQRIMALDDINYLVSFVNFDPALNDESDSSKQYGPGVVALIEINNNSIHANQILVLPFKNPYAFKINPKNSQEVWVMCSGAYTNINKKDVAPKTIDAGLVKLNIFNKNINISKKIPLPDFTPAEFELVGDFLVVPEFLGNKLLVLKEDSQDLEPIEASYSRKFNFTLATHWHEDIVFLGDQSGALVAYSLSDGFFPFPFSAPINISKEEQIKFSPSQVIVKKQEPEYHPGYGAWVVSHWQSKIIPLDFLKIFGP